MWNLWRWPPERRRRIYRCSPFCVSFIYQEASVEKDEKLLLILYCSNGLLSRRSRHEFRARSKWSNFKIQSLSRLRLGFQMHCKTRLICFTFSYLLPLVLTIPTDTACALDFRKIDRATFSLILSAFPSKASRPLVIYDHGFTFSRSVHSFWSCAKRAGIHTKP